MTAGTALTDFLNWWEGVLSKPDKFHLFLNLFRFPVPSVAFTSEIFEALEKVFDGRNPVQQYDFVLPEAEQDWQQYREEKHLPDFISKKVFDTLVEGQINCMVVVDLPNEQTGTLPEPYPYLLPLQAVHDYESKGDGFKWVAFWQADDRMAWFDETHYRIFRMQGPGSTKIAETLAEVPHDLGYTPVRWMWTDSVSNMQRDIKQSPLSKYLGEMDWLLAYLISKRVNELTAQYPVYWGYEPGCDYIEQNDEFGVYRSCHRGVLRDGMNNYILNGRTGGIEQCPACAKRRLLGPGSMVYKPTPMNPEDKDLGVPVGVVPAENVSLEYNQQEVERLKKAIFTGVTGAEKDSINDKAVNEKQVSAIVESRTQTLKNFKGNFEQLQKWIDETICRLRYGDRVFRGATINLGTEFHLYTADDLLNIYEKRRQEGASGATLDRLWEDYLSARFRFDPAIRQRETILMHLDPFRHKTPDEVSQMPFVPKDLLYLKFNFSSLIMRFEREQTNLLNFGSALSFDAKIRRIQSILKDYATEITDTDSAGEGEDDDAGSRERQPEPAGEGNEGGEES